MLARHPHVHMRAKGAATLSSSVQQVLGHRPGGPLWLLALTWLAWHWHTSALLAVAGAALISMNYSIFLAAEFILLRIIGRNDPVPVPGGSELVRAWLVETVQAARVFFWRQPFRWRAVPDQLQLLAGQCPDHC